MKIKKLLLSLLFVLGAFFALNAQTCQHSVSLIDSYGDGWNGGTLDVDVNSVNVLSGITCAGTGPDVFYFQAATGDVIDVTYTAGSYSTENEYTVYDGGGTVLGASGQGGATPTSLTGLVGNCPTCPPPTNTSASGVAQTTVDLSWNAAAGASGYYWEVVPAGNGQGNGVVTSGSTANTTVTATGLTAGTSYDAYVQNDCGSTYDMVSFATLPNPETNYPWTEGFENGGSISLGWSNEYVSSTVDWAYTNGGHNGNPGTAHTGSYNAIFYSGNYNGDQTKLVTPPLDLTGLTSPVLSYWHTQATWGGDQDELRVYYKTSAGGAWTLIPGQTYTASITSWTQESVIALPSPSADYFIAFEGLSGYGYGVCIDDVEVAEAPSCPDPGAGFTDNILATSAQLNWTENGGATLWDIELGTSGFAPSGTPTASGVSNPYTYNGLSGSTAYDWYVRSDCGGGSTSNWVGPYSFTTACAAVGVPFSESFDVLDTQPACWNNSGGDVWHFNTGAGYGASSAGDHTGNGGYYAWVDGSSPNGNDVALFTPLIDASSLSVPQLSFWMFSNNTNNPGDNCTLYVDFWDGAAWNNLLTNAADNGGWTQYTYDLSAYTIIGDVQFRFMVDETTAVNPFYNDILIDDVLFDEAPACPDPSAQAESAITASSVSLAWTDNAGTSSWDIELGATGFVPTGTPTATGVTNPYTYGSLSTNTTYDWYVRADCGGGSYSNWVGPSTFTTLPGPHSLPLFEDFESGLTYFDNAAANGTDWIMSSTIMNNGLQSAYNGYASNSDNILHETGLLDLSATTSPILQFAQIAKTEGGWDKCYVEISTNGGSSYVALPAGSYQGAGSGYASAGYFDEDDYSMWGTGSETPDNSWWKVETFDLSAYQTTNVRLRFRLSSDGSITRDGWYVDDVFVGEAGPATSSWTGAAKSTNWAASGNWDNGVPGPNTDVTIPAGVATYPTISASAYCSSLFMGSSATSNASLLDGGFLTVYGNVTAQQYLDAQTAGGNDNWHFVSPPVSGATAEGVFHMPASTGLNVYLQSFDETTNSYSDMVSGALNAAEGYAVWVDGANATPPVSNYTFEYVGGLNTGSFTSNLTRTIAGDNGGNNLVGNPYVSSLDWNAAGWTKTNVMAPIYVEDQGSWGIYDAVNGSTGTGNQGQFIAPGSGFFVFVSDDGSTTGTLSMDNTVRVHSTAQVLKSEFSNYLRIQATGNDRNDIAVVHFMEDADAMFNGQEDARKLFATDASYPQIYTVADKMLAANALPETEMVQMGFIAGVDGSYTIEALEINDLSTVLLEDTFSGEFTDLTNDTYTFTYSTSDDANRFILHFAPTGINDNMENPISIYSNNKNIHVMVPELTDGSIQVYNMIGQEVAHEVINGQHNEITLAETGYYVVVVTSNDNVVTQKVLIK